MDEYKTLKGGESATYEFPNGDFDSFRAKVHYHAQKTGKVFKTSYSHPVLTVTRLPEGTPRGIGKRKRWALLEQQKQRRLSDAPQTP